jgi:hypothetical protein
VTAGPRATAKPVITLVNPATGARFEYVGTWQRTGKATDADVRSGLARFRGDKVFLNLPPGVKIQLEKGVLQFADDHERTMVHLGALPAGIPDSNGMPMPDARASHSAWVDYAVSEGMDREAAAGMTKAQIHAAFTVAATDDEDQEP